tara:strand:- start:1142 stop:1630 length:489 start_codon:yes stop_codon:yes gene_type:complete
MKKNGFTLVELLVVVAIIGILAAVGVVAYNGYTSNAKKNTIKSRHAMIVKFFKAEFEKCNIDEEVFLANVNKDQCYRITDPTKRNLRLLRNIIILHINDTMEWKNVYDRKEDAATNKNLNAPKCDLGQICVKRDNANQSIIIVSNYDDNPANYLTSNINLGN